MSRIKDLASALSDKHGLSKQDAEKFVSTMFDLLNNALSSEKLVKVKGLGTFKVISVAPRKSVDVNTGEPIVIDGRDKISFVPDSSLRDEVNKPFAQFDTVVVNDGVDFSEIDRKFNEEEKEEEEKQEELKEEVKKEEQKEEQKAEIKKEEPKVEPVSEEKENPVIEEEVKPVVEEKVKSAVEENGEPVVEVEPEPVAEEKPKPAIEEEKKEEEKIVEEQNTEIADIKENIEDEHHKLRYVLIACAVVVIACFAGAFYMFSQLQKRDNRIAHLEAQLLTHNNKKNKQKAKTVKVVPTTPTTSSIEEAKASEPKEKDVEKEIKENNKDVEVAVAEKPQKKSKKDSEKTTSKTTETPAKDIRNYDSDPRIRTGAYNIEGIDQIVTIKSGQTLSSISKFYFGPGMECYVEAVNGGKKEFKAGDKIKIPKLKHKRKAK